MEEGDADPLLPDKRYEEALTPIVSYHIDGDAIGSLFGEACGQVSLALPVSLVITCRILIFATDAAFIGHIGTTQFAAFALAQAIQSMELTALFGCGVAVNTLCAEAMAASEMGLVGLWFQLGFFILVVLSVPVTWAFLQTQTILEGLLEECLPADTVALSCSIDGRIDGVVEAGCVCRLAGYYSSLCAFYVLPVAVYTAVRQYFSAQGIVLPTTIIMLAAVGFNVFSNWVLVTGFLGLPSLGFKGAPLATLATVCFQLFALVGYSVLYKQLHQPTWPSWTLASLRGRRILAFAKLAIPMTLALIVDEWVFQVVLVFVGFKIGAKGENDDVSAQTIFFHCWEILWGLFYGFGHCVQTRISRFLICDRPRDAALALKAGLLLVSAVVLFFGGGLYVMRYQIASIFNPDPAVVELVAETAPLFLVAFASSCFFLILSAALYGMGSWLPSLLSGVGSWVVNLPLVYLLGFQLELDLQGVWMAAVAAEALKGVWALVLILLTNWQDAADRVIRQAETGAQKRNGEFSSKYDYDRSRDSFLSDWSGHGNQFAVYRHSTHAPIAPNQTRAGAAGGGSRGRADPIDI